MSLIKQFCEFREEQRPFLRYDQYRRSDSQQHRNALQAEAEQVAKTAAKLKVAVTFAAAKLKPEPSWCEQIAATVGALCTAADSFYICLLAASASPST